MIPTLAFALLVSTAPAALAQSSERPAGDYAGRGDSIPLQRFDLAPQVKEDVHDRMGPEQRTLELVQTTLLNRFGGLGFARVLDVDKVGTRYLAQVATVRGETVTVEIDPLTGNIIGVEPVVAAVVVPVPQGGATNNQQMAQNQATGNQGRSAAGTGEYADIGSCQPAAWASISDQISKLPESQELIARRKMTQVWENYADGNRIACREKLEDIQNYLRTASSK